MGLFEEFKNAAKKGTGLNYNEIKGFWNDNEAAEMEKRSFHEHRSLDSIMKEELEKKLIREERRSTDEVQRLHEECLERGISFPQMLDIDNQRKRNEIHEAVMSGELDTDLERLTMYYEKKEVIKKRNALKESNEVR